MTVLLQHLWPALLVAWAMGFIFTALFGAGTRLPSARWGVMAGALLLLLTGILLSVLEVVPGRPGLWLDIGVLCAVAYAVGAGLGAGLRYAIGRIRHHAGDSELPG